MSAKPAAAAAKKGPLVKELQAAAALKKVDSFVQVGKAVDGCVQVGKAVGSRVHGGRQSCSAEISREDKGTRVEGGGDVKGAPTTCTGHTDWPRLANWYSGTCTG